MIAVKASWLLTERQTTHLETTQKLQYTDTEPSGVTRQAKYRLYTLSSLVSTRLAQHKHEQHSMTWKQLTFVRQRPPLNQQQVSATQKQLSSHVSMALLTA